MALGNSLITKSQKDGMLAIAGHEEETLALLSIGYGKLVPQRVLGHLRAASKAYGQTPLGDWPSLNDPDDSPLHAPDTDANAPSAKSRTLMHLALTGLNRAEKIRDLAPHLAEARKILDAGMRPLALLKALGLVPENAKNLWSKDYNPDEPRDSRGRWTSGGGHTITIHSPDGSQETRTGGSQAWRNNNPGNIRSGSFADQYGAIGSNNGFAVFPDEATGRAAVSALLQTPVYSHLTIDDAVAIYSPAAENDVAQNQRNVRSIGGFSGSEVVGSLSPDRFNDFVDAITRNEGWAPGIVARKP